MSKKRGQVTVFIIIGLVIAIIIFLTFFFLGDRLSLQSRDKTPLTNAQLIPLKSHVETCMKESIESSLTLLKLNAGYLTTTPYFTQYGGANINYLIYPENAVNKANSLSGIQDIISEQVELKIKEDCDLDDIKLNIKANENLINAETTINNNNIIATLSYPLIVSKGGASLELKDFSVITNTDFGTIYNAVSDITNKESIGNFDADEYFKTNQEVIIHKDNQDAKNILYLVTSIKEEEYVLFGVKK